MIGERGVFQAEKADEIFAAGDLGAFIFQDRNAGILHLLFQDGILTGPRFVVARHIIDRGDPDDADDKIHRFLNIRMAGVDQIAGDGDQVRRRFFHRAEQPALTLSKLRIVKVGYLDDPEPMEGRRDFFTGDADLRRLDGGVAPINPKGKSGKQNQENRCHFSAPPPLVVFHMQVSLCPFQIPAAKGASPPR